MRPSHSLRISLFRQGSIFGILKKSLGRLTQQLQFQPKGIGVILWQCAN